MKMNFLKWEAEHDCLAPLLNKERDSVIELTSATFWRNINVDSLDLLENKPKRIYDNDKMEKISLENYIELNQDDKKLLCNDQGDTWMNFNEIHFNPISSSHKFLCLYAAVEEGMEMEQDITCHSYVAQLQNHQSECRILLNQLDNALSNLKNLADQYTAVSTKTSALHTDCEHLLAEQTRLSNRADTIENKLLYFIEVNKINEKLSSTAFHVTSENFIPLLSKIDECISYIKDHSSYLESASYLTRYKICLNKALSMVKYYVIKSLENSAKQVNPQLGPVNPVAANALILYYSKFRTNAPRIKALMSEIEDRIDISSEYNSLLNDCQQCYFLQRKNLIEPCVFDAVNQLLKKYDKNYCTLIRSGCAFLVHVCEDEYSLYHQFFSITSSELEIYLQGLCSILYDALRPVIIHIDHLETLSQLCSILKRGMIDEHIQNNPVQLASLTTIVCQLLEDCQERLVYRAHIYIETDIANFKPSSGDLAYPSKLKLMESISNQLANQANAASANSSYRSSCSEDVRSSCSDDVKPSNSLVEDRFSRIGSSPSDLHGMWYPTVRRTLMCLSKVYRCTDRNVFQGLSLDALSACMQSLSDAATSIKKNNSSMDAQFFEIKHLLILREQLTPFQVDANLREMTLDWSKLKSAAIGLVHKRSLLFSLTTNNSLLEFIVEGTPQVTEHIVDSRRNVDNQLKNICEQFIASSNEKLIGILVAFEENVNKFHQIKSPDGKHASIKNQAFFVPERIGELVTQVKMNIRKNIPIIQKSLRLYLANKDTEFILFKPIRNNIVSAFVRFRKLLAEHCSEDDMVIISCPTSEEVVALLSSL